MDFVFGACDLLLKCLMSTISIIMFLFLFKKAFLKFVQRCNEQHGDVTPRRQADPGQRADHEQAKTDLRGPNSRLYTSGEQHGNENGPEKDFDCLHQAVLTGTDEYDLMLSTAKSVKEKRMKRGGKRRRFLGAGDLIIPANTEHSTSETAAKELVSKAAEKVQNDRKRRPRNRRKLQSKPKPTPAGEPTQHEPSAAPKITINAVDEQDSSNLGDPTGAFETNERTGVQTQPTAPSSKCSTPEIDYNYRQLLPLQGSSPSHNAGPTIPRHSFGRYSVLSVDTLCSNERLIECIETQKRLQAQQRVHLYSVSSPHFKPLEPPGANADPRIDTRPSVLSIHGTVAMDTADERVVTLSDYVRRNSLRAVTQPEDAFETTERIGPLGGVVGLGGCVLKVPHGGARERKVKVACWYTKETDREDRMLVTPTMHIERDCDVTNKPVRISLPTCYCASEEAKISVEWSSDGSTWRHLTEMSNNNSRCVEFETVMNSCRFRATVPKDPELRFEKFVTSVAFAHRDDSNSPITKITWCLCDAIPYSEARVWLQMATRGVHERVVEARTFAIRRNDEIKIQLAGEERKIMCKDLWSSQILRSFNFHTEIRHQSTIYSIARNGDVIIESDLWFESADGCAETSSLLERHVGAVPGGDHAHRLTNRNKVKRAKTTAGHGLRKLVQKVRKRKTSFN